MFTLTWIKAHWALVLPVLYASINLANGALGTIAPDSPAWKRTLHAMLDQWLLPMLTRSDAPGTLKLPWKSSRYAGKKALASVAPPPPPGPSAAMFLPFAFVALGFGVFGCGYCREAANKDTARCKVESVAKECAAPGVVKLVLQLLPEILADLVSGNFETLLSDLTAKLTADGIPDALAVVNCAIQNVTMNERKGAALTPGSNHALLHEHAHAWLKAWPGKKGSK